MLISSAVLTSFAFLSLGIYMYLQHVQLNLTGYGWIPLVSFALALFAGCAGIVPLPFVVIAEVMPHEV